VASDDDYVGSISMMPFPWPPFGTALCNGGIVPILQNTALFSLLGTNYGGDDSTVFGLPDFNARMPLGQNQSGSGTPWVIGDAAGREQVVLTVDNLPPHNHPVSLGGTGATDAVSGPSVQGTTASGGTASASPVGNTGGGVPVPTLPPFLTVSFTINLQGIYPEHG
jgi:microcystin-dependent protein